MLTDSPCRLATFWTRASDGQPPIYTLTLTNNSNERLTAFTLCVTGPARIDSSAQLEGGELVRCLSNFAELRPIPDFTLEPGQSWTLSARNLIWPLRHWTDGAQGAYLVLVDGTTVDVAVTPTVMTGRGTPLLRGLPEYDPPVSSPQRVSVVPWPNQVRVSGRRPVPIGLAIHHTEGSEISAAAAAAFHTLTRELFPSESILSSAEGALAVELRVEGDSIGSAESYRISFESHTTEPSGAVVVSAATTAGLLYGLVTLGQIWRGAAKHPDSFDFPREGEIVDEPAMGWRGVHLDVARQFYATKEITKLLAISAWNKLNRFHMHLSDDEAWRIEIDAYPELTEIGAWRGHGLPIPPLLGSGATRTGGYYTKPEIREIVAVAKRFAIDVVPEIDIPGHCFAMLQALPQLCDPLEAGQYFSVQGFPNNCINPALETTYEVVETILSELIELFPYRTIHIGADEVPVGAWSGSPAALAKLDELAGADVAAAHAKRLNVTTNAHGADDIHGSGAAVLQAMFIRRIHEFLRSHGCITGGWEEAAHGDVIDKRASYLCGWRSVAICADLAGQGYEMVVCPGQYYYLDMALGPSWEEPGGSWAGWTDTEKLYHFDPVEGWTSDQKQNLRGIQACIWSESMKDRAVFDRLVFPRLSALAENAWTAPQHKSWGRFNANAQVGLFPVLSVLSATS